MKAFHPTKVFRRVVKIGSHDRSLPDREWILTIGSFGVEIRRMSSRESPRRLSWRSIIGTALIHL